MSALTRLARALHEESRHWGRIESIEGFEPLMTVMEGVSEDHVSAPYLVAFRVSLYNPPLGANRQFTVTISESQTPR